MVPMLRAGLGGEFHWCASIYRPVRENDAYAGEVGDLKGSVVITSRNRRDDVLLAVASCFGQKDADLEVLVFDDASEDGTTMAVKEMWPEARVFEGESRVGYIVNRNRGFREATGDVVFSIDDDAYFSADDIVNRTMKIFEDDDSVGAVAIPYIEPRNRRSKSTSESNVEYQKGDDIRNYVGCAHAVRRDLALALGGYREYFVHQGEERDFCLRLRDAGWRVVYGFPGYIVHTVSPRRESDRIRFFACRNLILFDWLNLPMPQVILRMLWDSAALVRYRFSLNTLGPTVRGILAGYREALRRARDRQPVSMRTYRYFRSLPAHGPEDWQGELPPSVGPSERGSQR